MVNQTAEDWDSFVRSVASDLKNGLSTTELSQKYGGLEVRWMGQVREIRTADKFAPGVQLDMPHLSIPIGDRILVADYLFLNVSETEKDRWKTVAKGQRISFRAKIRAAGGLFSPIDIDTFPDSSKSVLSIALENGVPN